MFSLVQQENAIAPLTLRQCQTMQYLLNRETTEAEFTFEVMSLLTANIFLPRALTCVLCSAFRR